MISQINIASAGPLKNRELKFKKVNFVTGLNESGKTTVTDIITAWLMSGMKKAHDRNNFQKITGAGINRFGGSQSWKFDIKGDMVFPSEIDYNALSLLIVRSNKNVIQNKESDGIDSVGWWRSTARTIISGAEVSSSLLTKLREYTNTNKKIWSVIDRINSYRELLILKKDELNRFEKSRNDGKKGEERLKDVIAKMDHMRKVKAAADYKTMDALYAEFCEAIDRADSLEKKFSEEDLHSLKKISAEWESREKKATQLKTELANLLVEIEKKSGEKLSLERVIGEKKKLLGEDASPVHQNEKYAEDINAAGGRLAALESERANIRFGAHRSGPVSISAALLIGAGVISAAGVFFSRWALAAAALFFALGIIRLALDYRKHKKFRTELAERLRLLDEEIRSVDTALKIGEARAFDAEQAREAQNSKRVSIEREIASDSESLVSAAQIHMELLKKKGSLERELSDIQNILRGDESRHESRSALAAKIATAENALASLAEAKGLAQKISFRVQRLFETDNLAPSNLLAILENRKRGIDQSLINENYRDDEYESLSKEKDSLTGDSHDFQKNYSNIKVSVLADAAASFKSIKGGLPKERDSLKFYERYLDEFIGNLALNDLSALDMILDRTAAASARASSLKQYSSILFDAAAQVESRQDSLIASVISGPDFARYFSSLSGHEMVKFSIENGADRVDFMIGDSACGLDDLSAGALDQFYFAFRLSLLKRVFDSPSTIVLDDAFIHFDRMRRAAAISILKEFSSGGWQVIYSAVDDGAIEGVFTEVFGKEINIIRLGAN